ncbi:MAG: outer membrane protein assembly factor BamA, partial [Sphingobacteriia bacterium]
MSKRVRIWLVLVSLAQVVWAQDVLSPGTYVLAGIAIEGNGSTISEDAVRSLSGLTLGQSIDIPGEQFADAIRNIWKQNVFADVQIRIDRHEAQRLFITLVVEEKPRISKYAFRGIKKGQADDLRENIKLVRGQRFTDAKRRNAIRVIKSYFQEKGYYQTQVDVEVEKDPNSPEGIIILLKVDKGKRYKVADIRINGLSKFSESQLRGVMTNTKERRIYRIFKRSKFVPKEFEEDKQAIRDFLHEKGYRDADIRRDTVYALPGRRRVAVEMDMYEGRQYFIRNITWQGNVKYTTGTLDTLLNLEKGDVYSDKELQKRLYADPAGFDISSLYQDQGYLFFRVEPVELAVAGDSVDLEMQIFEGPIAYYDRIILEGNTVTSDYVVIRELRTLPGNRFSRAEIIRSQRELIQLGYFNEQTLNVVPEPNPEKGTVDIKYQVEEKANDRLFFQAGWGGRVQANNGNNIGGGLVGTIGVTLNNFSSRRIFKRGGWQPVPKGDGQQLTLQMQVNGRGFQNYSIGFVEPWFGGHKPNSLGINTNYSIQSVPSSRFRVNIYGLSVDLGRRLKLPDDYFRSFTTLGYRYYHVRNAQNFFPAVPNGFINIFSIRQTIDRTSTNSPIFPTTGSSISLSVEFTPPYSAFNNTNYDKVESEFRYQFLEFHKWKFRAEAYMRLTKGKLPLVLYPRAMFGFLGAYNRQLGVSPFERFYIGGDGLAGFNLDGREIIAGRGYEQFLSPNGGGTVYSKYTLELRQPVVLSPAANVWFHTFLEASNGWASFSDFDPFEMYRAGGVGIRLFLPMFGLLGLDFAMPF